MSPIRGGGKGERQTSSHAAATATASARSRKDLRAPCDLVGRAQEEIPERRMPLAMQPPEHGDPILALDCDRQAPALRPAT